MSKLTAVDCSGAKLGSFRQAVTAVVVFGPTSVGDKVSEILVPSLTGKNTESQLPPAESQVFSTVHTDLSVVQATSMAVLPTWLAG